MWKCSNCHEAVDDHFNVCWNCGCDELGNVDPEFSADDFVPGELQAPLQCPKFRFSVLAIMGLMTAVSVVFQVVSFGGTPSLIGMLIFVTPTVVFFYLLSFKNGPFDPFFRDWRGRSDFEPSSIQKPVDSRYLDLPEPPATHRYTDASSE